MARLGAGFTTKKVGARTVVVAAEKANKYNAKKRKVDGITFDSIKESKRYGELLLRERAGEIECLEAHKTFALFVNGLKVGVYECDFAYRDKRRLAKAKVLHGGIRDMTVEDVKSEATRTPIFLLKKALMKAIYGIDVVEV